MKTKILPLTLEHLFFTLAVLVAVFVLGSAPQARADTLYWYADGTNLGGNGTWTNSGGTQWSPSDTGGGTQAWDGPGGEDSARFNMVTSGTVTVSGTVNVNQIINGSSAVTFTGGVLNMTGSANFHRAGGTGINVLSDIAGGDISVTGAAAFGLSGATKSYTGSTTLNDTALMRIFSDNAAPSTTRLIFNGPINSLDLRANQQLAGLESTSSGANVFGATGSVRTLTLDRASGTSSFAGRFTHNFAHVNLVKQGGYTQVVTGTNVSNSRGTVTVAGGVLALNKTNGVDALGDGTGIITITAGSLLLMNGNQLAETQAMDLGGGTFDVDGNDETLGTLSLSDDSFLALGDLEAAGGMLAFADSSALDWGSATLTISGLVDSDTLRFGTSAAGLTSTQLDLLRFADYGNVAGQIDASGFVTPVPEPTSWTLIGMGLGALSLIRRRRRN